MELAPLSGEVTVSAQSTVPNARGFVRNLNILLKFARLYGLEHTRSAVQFDSTWNELEEAVLAAGDAGLLLGASGSQLLLDGVPLESTPAERSFADLLNAAGVASICFLPAIGRQEFADLVRIFMESGPKAAPLSDRLELYFGKSPSRGIRINEIRFVAEDSGFSEARVAAQLTVKTLGADAGLIQDWFRTPEKMIQLIAAAEGAHGGFGGADTGTGSGTAASSATGSRPTSAGVGGGAGPGGAGIPQAGPLEEADLQNLLRLLTQFGEASLERNPKKLDAATWQAKLTSLSPNAQITLRQALASVAAKTPSAKIDEAMMLRLAEDLAIRFAIERFQRGEVRVNAVRQMLEQMSHQLDTMHKLLKAREEKLASAGVSVESHADVLDRQFWAAVPESGKRRVLTSPEAWCIPPRNIQQYVEELLGRGESEVAADILVHYAACVRNKDTEARKKAAIGLGQLAGLYSKAASQRLQDAIGQIGQQMAAEKDPELQTLLGAAFVRLSQESATRRYYRAMQQSLDSLADLEGIRPSWAGNLRPRIGVENRVPEFIEEALTAEIMPDGLTGVLMRVPESAAEHLAVRLSRSSRCAEREGIVQLAKAVGSPCIRQLKEMFKADQPAKAATFAGLLSRLDPDAVEDMLPGRLREGGRAFQDAVIRQLSIAGAPERGQLLAKSLEILDPLVLPLALDEIGMCGDASAGAKLLRLAEGEIIPQGPSYLRAKAIEALGRMRAPAAAGHLRHFLEARKRFRWLYPNEIRMAAAQALMKLDPEWMRGFLGPSGLDPHVLALAPLDPIPERDFVRHRRYRRIRLPRNLPAVITSARGKYSSAISVLSLEGGLLSGDIQLPVGTEASLKIPTGLRSIKAQAVVRFVRAHQAGFEMVGMGLEDRAKLRRLLVALGGSDAIAPEPPAAS
jgi:hypothetical protein